MMRYYIVAAMVLLFPGFAARAADQMPGMNDDPIFTHVLVDQLEEQIGGNDQPQLHYEAQGWSGTDENKLWIKSQGTMTAGQFNDGQHEFLYDHAITPFFDLQAGLRADWDHGVARQWAAIGVQGLVPYFFDTEATVYVGENGRVAFRTRESTDWLMTNRLILTPEVEADLTSKSDQSRQTPAGFTSLDAGLRLRYEVVREFAPYIGVTYHAGRILGVSTEPAHDLRFTVGIRAWY